MKGKLQVLDVASSSLCNSIVQYLKLHKTLFGSMRLLKNISAKNLEATIIRELLDGYDPRAFPLDDDKSVVVNVSYFLMRLQGLVSNLN